MSTIRALCVTPRLAIHDIACRSARSARGALRGGESTHVVFVRRGAFAMHVGREDYIADPCTALVSWQDTEYRVSHPGDAGDDCTVIELDAELAGELLGGLRRHRDVELRLAPRVQAAYAGLLAVLRRWRGDRLACEEAAIDLIRIALVPVATAASPRVPGRRARRDVALAAIERLNDAPSVNHSVSSLSAEIGCSPCHLMHAFRAETGTTLRRYRLQLRLAAALHRLAAGHDDLAGLAAELGFASHAHLTDSLSRLIGVAPRQVRRELARAEPGWLRRFLEARSVERV
jgi:AraC-like DNA-binding protein